MSPGGAQRRKRVWAASTPSDLAGSVGGAIGLAGRGDDVTAGYARNLARGKPGQVRRPRSARTPPVSGARS
jgi:hypothetical protein